MLLFYQGKGPVATYWLAGVDPQFTRRKTHLRRDHTGSNGQSFHTLIRDSPKLRHKLQLTPDYLPRSQPINVASLEHMPKKYRAHPNHILLPPRSMKKKNGYNDKRIKATFVELVDLANQESSSLLRPRVGTFSPHENGNV